MSRGRSIPLTFKVVTFWHFDEPFPVSFPCPFLFLIKVKDFFQKSDLTDRSRKINPSLCSGNTENVTCNCHNKRRGF
jgi:hypothetical protein